MKINSDTRKMKQITKMSSGELKELAKKLNDLYWNEGLSQEEIGKFFGVDRVTISNWMKRFKNPIRDIRERKYHSLGKTTPNLSMDELWSLYVEKEIKAFEIADMYNMGVSTVYKWLNGISAPKQHLKKPNLSLHSELVYILAVLLGDGHVHCAVNSPYYISYYMILSVKDKSFAESFAVAVKKINLHPVTYKSRGHNGTADYINVVAHSKIFYNWYKSLSWRDIEKIGKLHPLDFIRGMYESEGSFYSGTDKRKKYCYEQLYPATNKNYNLLQFIAKQLERYEFDTSIYTSKKKGYDDSYRLYLKGGIEERQRFVSLITPAIRKEASFNG